MSAGRFHSAARGEPLPAAGRLTERQAAVRAHFDALAPQRSRWMARNRYFYDADRAYLRLLVPEGARVLVIGCGTGQALAALRPSRGVGLDLSPAMIDRARRDYPGFEFHVGNAEDPDDLAQIDGTFDYILLPDTIGFLDDAEDALRLLHRFAIRSTRLIVSYHSRAWEPVLWLAERLRLKMPEGQLNWLSTIDIRNLLDLAGWEPVCREWRLLLPKRALGLGPLVNRMVAPWPGIRRMGLRGYIVARVLPQPPGAPAPSVSIIVPCRNERGNIEPLIRRLPRFAPQMEVIFVEGHSRDGTFEECQRVQRDHRNWDIKVLRQDGTGKGDAVRKGFAAARNDVLMILDADLTVAPEALPKFYRVVAGGKGEVANGTRLFYQREKRAMRFLNLIANRSFAVAFSYLLNQRLTDTLCGTKVLRREDYLRIAAQRHYFGELDPFGDFDLLFGAAKLNLKIVEVPVRYADRTYGSTQISRFSHGWLLARMTVLAWRKLKAL